MKKIEYRSPGTTLKLIRLNKGMTQKEVCANIISRSELSKIENGYVYPSIYTLQQLIKNLDIEFSEFFILQGSCYQNEYGQLLSEFKKVSYSTEVRELQALKRKCQNFLHTNKSATIQNIYLVILGILNYQKTGNIPISKDMVSPVWTKLSKLDHFFLIDLFLINDILFFFPLKTAVYMEKHANTEILNYYSDKEVLRLSFKMNLGYMMSLKHKDKLAIRYFIEGEQISKKIKRFDLLAICLIRHGICLSGKDNELTKKGIEILRTLQLDDLIEGIFNEINP